MFSGHDHQEDADQRALPISTVLLETLANGEQIISFRVVPGGGFCDSKTMAREILRLRARLAAADTEAKG